VTRRTRRARLGRRLASPLAAAILTLAGTGEAQEARVTGTRPEAVEIETAQLADLQPGTRVGFVRLAEGRREVGSGWVLGASAGRAMVGLAPGSDVRVGDAVIRCPGGGNIDALRGAVAQLRDQAQATGQMGGELGARLGVIQTVMQARDAAVARGACDLGEYDAQLAVLARDLQSVASPVATSAAPAPATIPGAPAAAPQGLPPATAPPGSPGTGVSMPGAPAGAGGDTLSKLAGSAQSLIEKFLGGGGSAGAGGIGGAASPQSTLGAGVGTGGGTGSTGGLITVPNPGSGPGGLVPASPAGAGGRPTIATGSQSPGMSTPLPPVLGRRPQPARRSGFSSSSVLGTQSP
jgi:hypothetical protein